MQQQQHWGYAFYTSSGRLKFAYVTNPVPPETRRMTNKLYSQERSCFRFYYTSGTPHARHIRVHFELWGRPFHSSLLASIFILVLLWKEFISHSFVVTFHLSHSSGSPPVFYPAGDGCWIHLNVGCSASIYSPPLVSLNDKFRLIHLRQESAVSAFQFHYTFTKQKF